MKVLDAKVDWHFDHDNEPELVIQVDRIPELEELCFERRSHTNVAHLTDYSEDKRTEALNELKGGSLWFGEFNGYVRFFAHDGSNVNRGGYGGQVFTLKMKDGGEQQLAGPWSSRSGLMNLAGFTPSLSVAMICDLALVSRRDLSCLHTRDRGNLFAGHITLKLACEVVAKFLPGIYLVETQLFKDGEIYYIPSIHPYEGVVKPVKP